ncbi:MAG TPA: hypothetical protein VJM09_15490 [Sphingobium sp.]|nr:hypothetical protein [Sphingobium sp.]
MILRRLLPSLALFLSGCAGTLTGYPSLAKRQIENAPAGEAAAVAAAPVAADPALQSRIDALSAQARTGGAAFDKAWPTADRTARAAAGAAVSSEGWVAAQQALSALESARNDSVSALASLDVLYVERSNAVAEGKAQGGAEQIDAARAEALAIVDSQNDRIDALKGRLAAP